MADAEQITLESQLLAWKPCLDYVESLALRTLVELRIAPIVHEQSEGMPVAVDCIAAAFTSPPSDVSNLARLMRFLAHKQIFAEESDPHLGETFYSPTPASQKLVQEANGSGESLNMLTEAVIHGGGAQPKGSSGDPELEKLFAAATTASTEIVVDALLAVYKEQLSALGSLLEVGGGASATALGKITKACPELRGTNFDLPEFVAAAPEIDNVAHVGGNILEDKIPSADAVLLKLILHKYGDEESLKLLKNCRQAIPDTGKVIIVETLLDPEDNSPAGDAGVALDLAVMTISGGMERTEEEWRDLLKQAGFSRINIIKLPSLVSVIEAYPK